jgi:hypothetical protein
VNSTNSPGYFFLISVIFVHPFPPKPSAGLQTLSLAASQKQLPVEIATTIIFTPKLKGRR